MCENHIHRKPKDSDGRSVRVGLVGPKPRPEGVGDGHPVNIPEPQVQSEGGTQCGKPTWRMAEPGQACRPERGVGKTAPGGRGVKGTPLGGSGSTGLPRKASKRRSTCARTANRHRWVGREYQGERENLRQGTRQINPVTSGEGVPPKVKFAQMERWGVAVKGL